MSLILDGTSGVSDIDGTAATPAIRGTDANTGIFFPAADTIAFAEGGAEVARFDSSGNLLVGTTSASGFDSGADNLIVGGGSGSTGMTIYSGTTGVGAINFADGTSGSAIYAGGIIYNHNTNNLDFATSDGSGRMRIDSSGNLLVGTTTSFPGSGNTNVGFMYENQGTLFVSRAASDAAHFNRNSDGSLVSFRRSGTEVGRVTVTTTATTYNTSSDYRLKENITPMTGALAKVQTLKPVIYNWKIDGSSGQGFIAHELQAVVPDCVTGEKDAVQLVNIKDEEGNVIGQEEKPVYQGIDTSFLVATLTAAIQEQQALITQLQADVAALKVQP